jgi:2-polyprenyl-3-methyl-5-hydroxy-6-metoxy-1,4-benzoquinol methylase
MPFYEEIADIYDDMTRFDERLDKEIVVLKEWQQRYGFQTALDVACGTGLHALALVRLGVHVVGADISEAMLAKARKHAAESGENIRWIHAPMQQIAFQVPNAQYDAIFCLGNSLPHLLESDDLVTAFENFATLLTPDGILVLQLLNYARVLAEKERIVGIRQQQNTMFIRFYDFHPPTLTFNLLTVSIQERRCPHTLHSTTLYPYQQKELDKHLTRQALLPIGYYGTMQFHSFDPQTSPDLIIVAQRSF